MTVYETLAKVQADIAVPKSRTNKFGGYSYRNAEDIMEAVKPACLKHGAAFYVSDEIVMIGCEEHCSTTVEDKRKGTSTTTKIDSMGRFYVKATAVFVAGDGEVRVSALAREPLTKKGMDDAQVTGSASSYARKYALCGLFGIDGQDDPDAMDNRESNQPKKREPKPEDALKAAKSRANRAIQAYAKKAGEDPAVLIDDMKQAPGFGTNPDFFIGIAKTYEDALTNMVADNG